MLHLPWYIQDYGSHKLPEMKIYVKLKQYHNFCIKTVFVRKKYAVQSVHKEHDWVRKKCMLQEDNAKKNPPE